MNIIENVETKRQTITWYSLWYGIEFNVTLDTRFTWNCSFRCDKIFSRTLYTFSLEVILEASLYSFTERLVTRQNATDLDSWYDSHTSRYSSRNRWNDTSFVEGKQLRFITACKPHYRRRHGGAVDRGRNIGRAAVAVCNRFSSCITQVLLRHRQTSIYRDIDCCDWLIVTWQLSHLPDAASAADIYNVASLFLR